MQQLKKKKNVSQFFSQKIRKDYQGLAGVAVMIEAESEYSYKYAIEKAQQACSILSIFSRGAFIPDIKCVSKIKGSENIAKSTIIMETDTVNMQMSKDDS